jgi:oligopeptide transport system substrate-binding protein
MLGKKTSRKTYCSPIQEPCVSPKGIQEKVCISLHTTSQREVSVTQKSVIEALVQEGLQLLASGMPVVRCTLSSEERLYVQCITESAPDALHGPSDLLSSWLPPGVSLSTLFIQRSIFSIDILQNHSFLFIDIEADLKGQNPSNNLAGHIVFLERQIELTLRLPTVCQQMIIAVATPHTCSILFRQELLHWLTRYPPRNPADTLSELQRILLTTDAEFKGIRTPSHLLKLVNSHLHLKRKLFSNSLSDRSEKQLFYRLFHSKLQVPFGTKDVICLAISLQSLSAYERFDDRHILLACQQCLPSLDVVPQSFYVYSNPQESTLSLYIEVEKRDGSLPTLEEMKTLKRELGSELISSIEQVSSRIDIPQNEEDLLRNLLLLNQRVKTPKDPPQVIVQFHGQTDNSLDFHVTLVRSTKENGEDIPLPTVDAVNITRCVLLRSSIVDRVRSNLVKQGLMFLVECSKERFFRRDRSVDFLKARESVVHCIESAYGQVRDLNGGLVYQHHQLLASIQPLLTKEESKDIPLIEGIFHSLSPTVMKAVLGPEHIVTVFRQLLILRADFRQKVACPFLVEEYAKEIFIGFLYPETFVNEDLFQAIPHFHLEENEFALCRVTAEGRWFCFVICLCQEATKRQQLVLWLQERLNRKMRVKSSRSLRMSLPRPTCVLDPRIGADRTSGAVIKMLYEGLMRLDPSETPSLAAAEEVLISDNGKTYTFKLRQSSWSNGQPVTAHDFEYAWKKILDPCFNTYLDFLFYPILNARLVKAGRLLADDLGVHAVNDHKLVVELEKPFPHFLELCTLWIFSPLCKDIDNTYPGWAYYGNKNYVCNGPFTLKQVSHTGDIHLEKNARYWDRDRVFLEKIDISIIEDPKKALQMFSNGELDWVGDPLSEVPLIDIKENRHKIYSQKMSGVQCYMLNVHHPLFRSVKIRHAFSQAIHRKDLISQLLYGDERPAHSVLASSISLLSYHEPLPFDLDNARNMFQEGLTEQGLSISHLKPLKIVIYNQEPYKSVTKYIARAWEKAFGISIIIEPCSWTDFVENFSSLSYGILGTNWYSWYRDPCCTLRTFSDAGNHFNSSRFSSETIRELLDRAELEQNTHARNEYLREAELQLLDELPVIPIYECTCRYMKSDNVENLYISPLGNVEFKWATFEKNSLPAEPAEKVLAHPQQEVKLYLQAEPLSLDPRIGGDRQSQTVIRELFEGLTRIGKDGRVELALAKSLSVSSDGRLYTFRLHPSKWSNGMELTAEDFVWAWKSALDPSFPSKHYYGFFPIKNAKAARKEECSLDDVGVKAIDPHTLEVTLEVPALYFLELLSNPLFSPICKDHVERSTTWAQKTHPHFVSNGPFLIKERLSRSHILLERNPLYWHPEKARSERLSFAIIDDPQTAYDCFQSGKLDWYGDPFGNMSLPHVDALERQGLLIKKQTGAAFWINCRTDVPHLSSPKIRKAIASAIHRKEICDTLLNNSASPAFSLLPQSMTLLQTPPFEEDPESARRLFAEGLHDLGYTKESYPPIVITHWSDPTIKAIVHTIQQQLQHVFGIRIEVAFYDWKDYMNKLGTGDYQLQSFVWFPWFDDPMYNLQYVKYKNTGLSRTGWERSEYINLLNLADTAQSPALRNTYLQKAEAFVMNELPVIPIFYKTHAYAKSPHLSGETLSTAGALEIKWLECVAS